MSSAVNIFLLPESRMILLPVYHLQTPEWEN
jgi:hypothetical protein